MKKIIKHILKEEVENIKLKNYLDKIVSTILSSFYIEEKTDELVSFGSIGEMEDLGILDSETQNLINSEDEFRKLGWDYEEDEDGDYYYYRVEKPQYQYDYDEFYHEIIYEWLNTLVDSGELGYDDEMGDSGEWYFRFKSLKLTSDFLRGFNCYFHWDVLNKGYRVGVCNNPSNRIVIMKLLDKDFNVSDGNSMDYVLTQFFNKLPEIVKNLSEEKNISIMNEGVIDDFIEFAKSELSLGDDFKVDLVDSGDELDTLGNYNIDKNKITILTKNRADADIIRSIGHEMVHHQQNSRGDLRGNPEEGETGSPWEDEANAKAGSLVRKFGEMNPDIYDL
jgi:hypothetical protein